MSDKTCEACLYEGMLLAKSGLRFCKKYKDKHKPKSSCKGWKPKEKNQMRIIKKYAIGKDNGEGDAIFFEKTIVKGSTYSMRACRTVDVTQPQYGDLGNAKLFINEKEADDFIKENDLKDSWPVEIMVGNEK